MRLNVHTQPAHAKAAPERPSKWEARIAVATVLVFGAALSAVLLFSLTGTGRMSSATTVTTVPLPGSHLPYPIGIRDKTNISGMGVPARGALAGYRRTYATDFLGTSLPPGWQTFTGVPGGDPNGQFATSHVIVSGGLLRLNAWRDAAYGTKWVTGGLCQCLHAQTFGAYFLRSRVTGAGPNASELLWPQDNNWPPEVDFNETGPVANSTSWTVHFGRLDTIAQQKLVIDVTKWHTWGVVWTPTVLTFTVDGLKWGTFSVPTGVPRQPMTLDLQQRAGCGSDPATCPMHTQSMLVDWVAEYTHA